MTLQIGDVTVEIIKKRVRRINLHVTPTRVWMSVPHAMPAQEAENFVRGHLGWIAAQRAKCADPVPLATGSTVPLWGAPVRLVICEQEKPETARLCGAELTLFVRPASGEDARRSALDAWYRMQLLQALPPVRERWERVVGEQASECRVRSMHTRWGTCSLRARRVWLSVRLAEYPPQCLDYVMVHELTHLLVPNHSAAFWGLMDTFYPNWRAVRAQLRQPPKT